MANEKRNLIDRDELVDSLGVSDMEIFAKEVIGEAPTVDAVEVVRCKDCKHLAEAFDENLCCSRLRRTAIPYVREDDFCSYGERKEK